MPIGGLVSVEVTGTDSVLKGLGAILSNIQDLTPFWRDVLAPKYFQTVQALFATGGRAQGPGGKFVGGAWAALSPKYKVWKQQHFPGQPILVRTGALRQSLTWQGGQLGPGGVFTPMPGWVVLGTSVPWARFHQHGTKRMPARPFMPAIDMAVFVPLLQQWILKTQPGGPAMV